VRTTEADLRDGRARRRRHSAEFKALVIAKCGTPGVSIAAVAMRHGLNANLLRRWVAEARVAECEPLPPAIPVPESEMTAPVAGFVPVQLEGALPTKAMIEVELRRGPVVMKVSWPLSASRECGLWLRELLK
jgi:transposase-like protein